MGSDIEIFKARVLRGNLSFLVEKSQIWRIVSCFCDNLSSTVNKQTHEKKIKELPSARIPLHLHNI
jgi:hypothetical protein